MKIRTKFLLFIIFLHLLLLGLSYFLLKQNKIIFIVSEIFIAISIAIAWYLYRQFVKPLELLRQGAEAIREKDFNIKFTATGQYEMDELIHVYNQMADELRKERTRQEQQYQFLEKLIETSPTGILILDFDEHIHDVNPKALKLLKVEKEAIAGKPVDAILHPLMKQINQLKLGGSKTVTINGVNTYKLQKSHFIDRGFSRHFIMIEELTADILAAEKKAYGKVIRMMAHEVNNTIGPVNSILQTALGSEKLWSGMNGNSLRNALQVAYDRNTSLSIFMKNFTEVVRLPEPKKVQIDLHQLITRISSFAAMMAADKRIQFVYNFDAAPFFIMADEHQMEQVLINVVKNSIEAIEHEGTITFTTHPESGELVIADNGRGLKEDIDQLFSPFFSTKKDGQGIGLTLVKEILINHGYEFSLQSGNGETRFVFIFGK
jgi:two-component system, NtrC family, nitrogen regulation sensor histidine kinase NtrY